MAVAAADFPSRMVGRVQKAGRYAWEVKPARQKKPIMSHARSPPRTVRINETPVASIGSAVCHRSWPVRCAQKPLVRMPQALQAYGRPAATVRRATGRLFIVSV